MALHPSVERLRYRPDIDGLRALAVLLVLLDHLGTRVLGGYIGVDVFFVISGYLISAHILSEAVAGRFSLLDFYERRARRILPALLVMLVGATVLALFFLLPPELVSYAESMRAALLSFSNFFFWSQAGYFDGPSSLKPLLHTWSLGVEEQFYFVFPLFILALRRWLPRAIQAAIWVALAISFIAACIVVRHAPSTAFFWSPLRAWELLIGTVVSQGYLPSLDTSFKRNIGSLCGLSLILIPALRMNAQTPFPGVMALAPCIGAALLIAAGETGSSLLGRLLSLRPIVFLGLISYSLYLWHWPLIVYWRYAHLLGENSFFPKQAKMLLIAVSIAAATLSWALVETPFRKGRFKPSRRSLFAVTGAALVVMLLVCSFLTATHGRYSAFSPAAQQIAAFTEADAAANWRRGTCFLSPPEDTFSQFRPETCLAETPGRSQVLLLGDSHAADLYAALAATFPAVNVSQANAALCAPLLAQPGNLPPEFVENCTRMREMVYGGYLQTHHPQVVVLSAVWGPGSVDDLGRSIAWLQEHHQQVVVIGPQPQYDQSLPRLLAYSLQHGRATWSRGHTFPWPRDLDRTMARLARSTWHVRYISAFEDLCGSQVEMVAQAQLEDDLGCPVLAAPGVPMFYDAQHLTSAGALVFARRIRELHQLP